MTGVQTCVFRSVEELRKEEEEEEENEEEVIYQGWKSSMIYNSNQINIEDYLIELYDNV